MSNPAHESVDRIERPIAPQRTLIKGLRDATRRCGRVLVDAVFPRTCPGCGDAIPSRFDAAWCEVCSRKMTAIVGLEYCTLCGRTTGPYELRSGRCGVCRDRMKPPISALVRVGPHKSVLRQMVLDFKFHQAPLDRTLGTLLAAAVRGATWSAEIDVVVPIPAHWRRRLERGHYPTRAVSRIVGRDLSLPVVEVLRRTEYRPPQVGLSRNQRAENVRGTFGIVRGARVSGISVCLIDDVTTTGATLEEAARTLRKAGVAKIHAAVLSKSESVATL